MTAFVVALALCYVLIKIPFWILGSVNISQGRSMLGSMAKAFLAYKTFGLAGVGVKKAFGAFSARKVAHPTGRGWTDPYEHATSEADGQGVLPLAGMSPGSWGPRARQTATAHTASSSPEPARRGDLYAHPRRDQGRQGALLTRQGAVNPLPRDHRARPHPGVPREARPGEQTMLRVVTRHEPDREPRESLHDALARPVSEPAPAADDSEQPPLFTPDGRIRSHARPISAQPGDVPPNRVGHQQALNMRLRLSPEQTQRRARALSAPTPAEPASPEPSPRPPRTKGQQPLLRPDGQVHPRARARASKPARTRARQQARAQQHHRAHSAPPAPEFQPPPPPGTTTRRGRITPAPDPLPGTRTRSTRLNTPNPDISRSRKENTDE